MIRTRYAAAVGVLAMMAGAAMAQTNVNSSERGWYNDLGIHQTSNDNYFAGVEIGNVNGNAFRNFFVFDIPTLGVGEDYTSAILSLISEVSQVGVPETYTLWSVETGIAALVGGTGGPAATEDLGDGTVYGTATITSGLNQTIDITLNSAGLAAINGKKGQQIAFGGTLTNLSAGDSVYAFGFTGSGSPSDGDSKLILQSSGGTNGGGTTGGDPVPEPGEWAAMGILGAGLAGLVIRKRRNG